MEPGEHSGVVDAVAATFGMAGDQRVLPGAGTVHPGQLAGHAQPGLVEPGHLGGGDPLANLVEEPVEPVGGPLGHRGHGGVGERGAEQLGQRFGGALLRQELPDIEVEHDRGDPRPVLHRRAHALGCGAAGGGPARTAAGDELMFDHAHRHRWQVEHLAAFHPHFECVRQAGTAPATPARFMPIAFVRVRDQRQRRPGMAGLPTRLAATAAAQRLRRRLGEWRVRRRRARRVGRVPGQLLGLLDRQRMQATQQLNPGVRAQPLEEAAVHAGKINRSLARHTAIESEPAG